MKLFLKDLLYTKNTICFSWILPFSCRVAKQFTSLFSGKASTCTPSLLGASGIPTPRWPWTPPCLGMRQSAGFAFLHQHVDLKLKPRLLLDARRRQRDSLSKMHRGAERTGNCWCLFSVWKESFLKCALIWFISLWNCSLMRWNKLTKK